MDYETLRDIDAGPRPILPRPGQRGTRSSRIAHGAALLGISAEMYELHVEAGERWCSKHGRWCPAADFPAKGGSCRAGHAEYMRTRKAARERSAAEDAS